MQIDEAPEGRRRTARAEVSIGANCRTATGRRAFVAMIDLTTADRGFTARHRFAGNG